MELTNEQNPQQTLTPSEVNPPIETGKASLLQRVKSNPMRVTQLIASALLIVGVVALSFRGNKSNNQNVSSTISNIPQSNTTITPKSADTPTPATSIVKQIGTCPTNSTSDYTIIKCSILVDSQSGQYNDLYAVVKPISNMTGDKVHVFANEIQKNELPKECHIQIYDDTNTANLSVELDSLKSDSDKKAWENAHPNYLGYQGDFSKHDLAVLDVTGGVGNFNYLFIPLPTAIPTDTPTPTPTPIPYDANGFPEDAQRVTVADIAKVPSAYEGKKVTFTCTVLSFPKDINGNAAGLNCSDPNYYSSLLQVDMGTFDSSTNINKNDTVAVYGMVQGSASGTNAFGVQVSEAVVLELHLKDNTT